MSIKHQLRFTTLVPLLLMSLLLAFCYNWQYSQDVERGTIDAGRSYLRQLKPIAEYALLQNDRRLMHGIISSSLLDPDIKSVAFYNAKGRLLAYRGNKRAEHSQLSPQLLANNSTQFKSIGKHTLHFISPVDLPDINVYKKSPSNPSLSPPSNLLPPLGWISLEMDTKNALIKKYQAILISIFIALIGTLIGLLINFLMTRRIYRPIETLTTSMSRVLQKQFDTTISTQSKGEIGTIEKACVFLQNHYLESINELNKNIELATADLQQNVEFIEEKNIALTLAKKEVETKSRSKSEFIANISHEIRTPLNGLIGFSNVLLETTLSPIQNDYVKTIKRSAQNLLLIINDILDFSKIEAGKLQLDYIPMDIRSCIDEVLSLFSLSAGKKKLELIPITYKEVPLKLLGDPLRLKQVITNLLSNAIKFTDSGQVVITTEVSKNESERVQIRMHVRDTGIGLCKADQEKLFNAFQQADVSTTRHFGGTGLGLVIAKKLVEKMSGEISLKSEKNEGSCFTFTFWADKLSSITGHAIEHRRYSHLNALFFEENNLQRKALLEMLRLWDVKLDVIDDIKLLKEKITANRHYDLFIIGINKKNIAEIKQIITSKAARKRAIITTSGVELELSEVSIGSNLNLCYPISHQKILNCLNFTMVSEEAVANSIPLPMKQQSVQPQSNITILVAEDNPINQMLFCTLLERNGFNFNAVANGREAIIQSNQKKYDLIIVDLQMPELNGIQASKLIRQSSLYNKKTPIVAISASINQQDKQHLKQAGIDQCLEKPVSEEQFYQTISRWIKIKSAKIEPKSSIDWSQCLEKMGGKANYAREILDKLIEQLLEDKHSIKQAYQSDDKTTLLQIIHKLHGSSCFCGVPMLKTLLKQSEISLQQDNYTTENHQVLLLEIENVLLNYQNNFSNSTA